MAALHSALQSLGPASFASIPSTELQAKDHLRDLFAQAQIIIDSVPPPPAAAVEDPLNEFRSRSGTSASNMSGASVISSSSARSDPFNSLNVSLQKEWGKPIRLAAKDNPLGMPVYRMAGRDGRGAWFARRSVHEGMGFKRWKLGLQREFPESMEVQGGPGVGNVRGIGGERRVEMMKVKGAGTVEGELYSPFINSPLSIFVRVMSGWLNLIQYIIFPRNFRAPPLHEIL